jgi:hypothetical protein
MRLCGSAWPLWTNKRHPSRDGADREEAGHAYMDGALDLSGIASEREFMVFVMVLIATATFRETVP